MKRSNFLDDIYIGGDSNCINITDKKYNNVIGDSISRLSSRINSDYRNLRMYDSWYILDDKYYYYKYTFAFYELLMSELFKYFNLECPTYKIALNNGDYGIISENFRSKDSMFFNYKELHIWKDRKTSESLNEFKKFLLTFIDYNNSNELLNKLFSLLSVDFFSGQKDRHYHNILFRVLKENNFISLAPLSDNGSIFKDENFYSIYCYAGDFLFPKTNIETKEKEEKEKEEKTLKFITENPEFKQNLSICLDIDINLVIRDTLEKYFLKITYDEKLDIIEYFDQKKSIIDNTLKLIK